MVKSRGGVVKGVEHISTHLSGAGSSPAGSVGRDLQKLNYQYLTTSVAVVLVVR